VFQWDLTSIWSEEIVKKIAPFIKEGQIVMDICSIKASPVKIMHKHIEMAMSFARCYSHDGTLPAFVTAMIVSGGRVLSVGYNSRRIASPLQEHYKTNPYCNSIHAEVDAILNVRRKIDLTGSKIIVVRRLKYDTINNPFLVLAKPCPMCQAVLYSYGIKRAIYTIPTMSMVL
jgi:deoxycytidylate deaminase